MDFLSVSVSEPSQSVETTLWWLTWWPTWRWTRWLTWRWTWWLFDLKLTQLAHLLRFCKSISPSSSMNLSPTLLPLQGGWAHKRRACTSVWLDDLSNNQNSEIFEKCSTLDDYFLHVVDTSNRVCGLAHISPSISVCHLKFESDCCICIIDVIETSIKWCLVTSVRLRKLKTESSAVTYWLSRYLL